MTDASGVGGQMRHGDASARHVYADAGNPFVAAHVPVSTRRILDIGCGSGDTARLIKARLPAVRIEGITYNPAEAARAAAIVENVHSFDLEGVVPSELRRDFDCLLFSHVLEHMRDPVSVVERLSGHLVEGGTVLIAVPNILEWRTRLRFLRGDWTYADSGVLDRTHLTFVTFETAEDVLLGPLLGRRLRLESKIGQGTVPLKPLRSFDAGRRIAGVIDEWGARTYPNLFAQQVLIVARKLEGTATGGEGE